MDPITVTYMIGDADGDEDVTIVDATLIQRKLVNIPVFSLTRKPLMLTAMD